MVFSVYDTKVIGHPYAKKLLHHLHLYLVQFIKINSECVTDLYVKTETLKFLKTNLNECLCVPGLDRDFLDMPPKCDQHTQKDTIKNKQRQATD